MIQTICPFQNKVLQEYPLHTEQEVADKITLSQNAQRDWADQSLQSRLLVIKNLSKVLMNEQEVIANLMHEEMGKPFLEAKAEVLKCKSLCDYYVNYAEDFLRDLVIKTDYKKSYVSFQPLGIVLSIMPWNFPIWQVFRFIVPSLIVGNSSLLKHATNVSGTSLLLENIFLNAGLAKGVFQSLLIPGPQANQLIAHESINAVTFTGSTDIGKEVAKTAGENLKKVVLELGGSDPYIILEDADLDLAASKALQSRFINSGQSCIAAKRFIVNKAVADKFIERLLFYIKHYKVGSDKEANIGPLAKASLVKDINRQYQDSIDQGAKLIYESSYPKAGNFVPLRMLTNCNQQMPVFTEETFGPLVSIFIADSDQDALNMANNSIFGLGAAIFSQDSLKAENLAKKIIQAGSVSVNDFVKSDPRLPFGGIKQSGIGRELSHFGLHEFVNIKTITVA